MIPPLSIRYRFAAPGRAFAPARLFYAPPSPVAAITGVFLPLAVSLLAGGGFFNW